MVNHTSGRGTNKGAKKRSYSIAFRHEVINYYEAMPGRTMSDTASNFKIPLSTVKTFCKSKNKLGDSNKDDSRQRLRQPMFVELEQSLVKFIKLARDNRMPVTSDVIKTKARKLRDERNISEDVFKVSNGWLQKFLRRHNVRSVRLYGEAGEVNVDGMRDEMISFCRKLSGYQPQYIYNQDESGYVYQLLPNVSYLAPEESRKEARGCESDESQEPRDVYYVYQCRWFSHS